MFGKSIGTVSLEKKKATLLVRKGFRGTRSSFRPVRGSTLIRKNAGERVLLNGDERNFQRGGKAPKKKKREDINERQEPVRNRKSIARQKSISAESGSP